MLLSRNDQPPRRLLQVASNSGGLGDALARMVAIRETLICDPNVDIRLFASAYMLPLIERMNELRPFLDNGRLWICDIKDIKEWLNPQQVGIAFAERSFTPSRLSLVDDGLLTLADSVDSINGQPVIKDYCTISTEGIELPLDFANANGPFVAVTTGFTAVVRSWPVAEVNKYLSWLKSEGFTPVLLGSKDTTYVDTWLPEGIDASGCIDLRDKTTLLEAARVLEACRFAVGVDNGLLHLAGSVGAYPIVIAGYTTIEPRYREIYRDGANVVAATVTPEGLDCSGCQSRFNFAFEHDFRTCLYNDLKCRELMTADAFITATITAGV